MVYSGVGAIRGYATYLDGASRAATFMKSGGYIAIAFSGLNATNEVMYACTAGREGTVRRSQSKSTVSLVSALEAPFWGKRRSYAGWRNLCGCRRCYRWCRCVCLWIGRIAGGGLLGGAAGEKVGSKFGDSVNTLFLTEEDVGSGAVFNKSFCGAWVCFYLAIFSKFSAVC